MTDPVMIWILGGGFLFTGIVLGMTTKKLDKKDFEKHCDNDREDKGKMFEKIDSMNQKLTEVHTIIKRDQK
jgi:hypothetical protein